MLTMEHNEYTRFPTLRLHIYVHTYIGVQTHTLTHTYKYKYIHTNTGCINMIGAVSICHYGFENAHNNKFPTRNETAGKLHGYTVHQ